MVKKILTLGMALMMLLAVMSCCQKGIWFNLGYADVGANSVFAYESDEYRIVKKIDLNKLVHSLDELKSLCNEYNNPAFSENNSKRLKYVSEKIRGYDEKFFRDKSLVVYLKVSFSEFFYKINHLEVKENQLCIVLRAWEDRDVMIGGVDRQWAFLIEVKKADIANVTDISVNYI